MTFAYNVKEEKYVPFTQCALLLVLTKQSRSTVDTFNNAVTVLIQMPI